jgi:AcrR family transcriptional regulator
MTVAAPLRERQAQQVREALLEAAVAALEAQPLEAISMAEVARAAGVSLRTLYRYFPDRAGLLEAASEHLYASLGVPIEIGAPDAIAGNFREAARRLSARPRLVRALVQTQAGRAARSRLRGRRREAIEQALQPLLAQVEPALAQKAAPVIAHLCSAASWVAVADDSDLSDSEAQAAVGWAIETLVEALRSSAPNSERRPS